MKRLFPLVCLLIVLQTTIYLNDSAFSHSKKSYVEAGVMPINKSSQTEGFSFLKPAPLVQFAWQIAPPERPIEERPGFSWWWWVVGVIITFAVGILLYVAIKKNPRKDVR